MIWLFPSWPSKKPQVCLAQSSGAAKSWRSSAIFCPTGQSSLCQTSIPQAVSLGVLQEYPPCSLPDLCNSHVWCHHWPPKSSERNWLRPGSPSSPLHGFFGPPFNRNREETIECPVLLGLAAAVFFLLEYMNSLPSTLPQRPHLPTALFLFLPSMALRVVYIFFVNLAPSPGELLQQGPHQS